MAMWALGKVKSVATGIKNVKEVGNKIKNYYVTRMTNSAI